MGGKNSKMLLLPQITVETFQTFSDFFLSGPDNSAVLDFEILSL